MGTADRLMSLIERIQALDQRMEDHMRDPFLDPEIRTRMGYLHEQWRNLLVENMAAMGRRSVLALDRRELEAENAVQMERMKALLHRLERDVPAPDDDAPSSKDQR